MIEHIMDESEKTLTLRFSERLTLWIGSPSSIIFHTIFFIGMFGLELLGVPFERILLVLTTAVSLEAIYLAIFIQMTVNRHTQSLEDVEEEIEELGEEVEDISEEIDKIHEEETEERREEHEAHVALDKIQASLKELLADVESIKRSSSGV